MDEESSSSSSSTSTNNEYEDSEFYHSSSSHDENETETTSKNNNGEDDGLNSPVQPMSSLNEIQPKPEPISVDDLLCRGSQNDSTAASICHDTTFQPVLQASHEVSSSSSPTSKIPHRGALRRILNPSSFHVGQNNIIGAPATAIHQHSNQQNQAKHGEVVYAINVATNVDDSVCSQNSQQQSNRLDQYQLIFDRQQYEFCTRLFALLDKESQSTIGPECIQEFVCLHCPVVRRRDDAIFALRYNSNEEARSEDSRAKISLLSSPTFDEIWDKTVQSTIGNNVTTYNPTIQRIGIEGWMVFCRLLSLAQHQESQRRFASRHLQQMCVHKHSGGGGGGSTRLNPNEIVVVVDNPPPGPPLSITIQSLVDIEQERATASSHANNESIPGWPFCPLPLPELDLDHCLVSTYSNNRYQRISSEMHQRRGSVSIEPFSSSQDGDFILRYKCNDTTTMVVRRSYLDFEWLNTILKLHKRPGQGHLCGRILPPFPSKQGYFHQQRSGVLSRNSTIQRSRGDSNSQKDISERAISVAKSGVGIITSMAKSVWSGYVSSPSSTQKSKAKKRSSKQQIQWASQSKQDVPTEVAKKLERYLNYLQKNSALSSSFPLNAILQASQSGLESTKQILQEHTKKKKKKKTQQQGLNFAATNTPKEGGLHSAASIFSTLVSKSSLSIMRLQGDDDTSWLRAAAQVAMALQFHGILETTGNESTSAKIQHASLPKFQNQPTGSWDEEDGGSPIDDRQLRSSLSDSPKGEETDFEQGIVKVESELVDSQDIGGYDLLPSPGPSDEHRVLNAGSVDKGNTSNSPSKSRFIYETASSSDYQSPDRKEAVLGTIRVDNDIDKLRDIIRSISQTLGKLHQSSASIQSAQNERNVIQSDILRNVDSWGDTGDEIISQRALVNGVASLELFNNIIAESNMTLTDDLSWQSSLASSAVDAVTEVRDAVRASRTASRAKSAAYIAAEKAKKTYESCDHSSSKEKIQHTQSEASKAQSHAIHATVVEYEANIAKKRSAVSLAQDVKSWNQHRKKEICRSCVQFAKSQQEACRKSADAWGKLREGLINKSTGSFATDDASLWVNPVVSSQVVYQGSSTALGTLTHGKPVYTNISDFQESNNLETSSDWETGVDASNSLSSSSKGFTDLKQSRESSNVYCLSSQNIDDDYFSFHQSIASSQDHSVNNDDDYNEDHSGAGSCQSDEVDEPVEGLSKADPMSTSMQSLIDGLMSWGEQEQSSRSGGGYNTNLLD